MDMNSERSAEAGRSKERFIPYRCENCIHGKYNHSDSCCEDGEAYYEHVTASMKVEHEDKSWFKSAFDDCVVKFTCEEDRDLNCRIKLYKSVDEEKWCFRGYGDSVELNSLRNLSDFEVFLMTLKRGFVDIVMDEESDCDNDIEPEEKPEWSLG